MPSDIAGEATIRRAMGGPTRRSDGVIRLAVVDDHPAIATAIAAAVAPGPAGSAGVGGSAGSGDEIPIEIVGTARTADDGVRLVSRTGPDAPDVVICDVQLESGTDGFRVLDAARTAGVRAIVHTAFDRSSLMRAAFERGALGFLDKGAELGELIEAIRRVAAGGTAFSAAGLSAARLAPRMPSDREVAVLQGIGGGLSSDEIGARLGISGRTVESHLRRLFDRYGVVSRAELAVLAVREGWIDAGPERDAGSAP
jgi:DNA-binding NarL/FixJ family response regulator